MWYAIALKYYPSCPAYNCDFGPPYENVYDKQSNTIILYFE